MREGIIAMVDIWKKTVYFYPIKCYLSFLSCILLFLAEALKVNLRHHFTFKSHSMCFSKYENVLM
jgi:hypothetical protein